MSLHGWQIWTNSSESDWNQKEPRQSGPFLCFQIKLGLCVFPPWTADGRRNLQSEPARHRPAPGIRQRMVYTTASTSQGNPERLPCADRRSRSFRPIASISDTRSAGCFRSVPERRISPGQPATLSNQAGKDCSTETPLFIVSISWPHAMRKCPVLPNQAGLFLHIIRQSSPSKSPTMVMPVSRLTRANSSSESNSSHMSRWTSSMTRKVRFSANPYTE